MSKLIIQAKQPLKLAKRPSWFGVAPRPGLLWTVILVMPVLLALCFTGLLLLASADRSTIVLVPAEGSPAVVAEPLTPALTELRQSLSKLKTQFTESSEELRKTPTHD